MARTTRARRRLLLVVSALLGVVVIGGLGFGGLRWYRGRQAIAARDLGLAKYEAKDYEAALPLLSTYVSRYPEDVAILVKLASCRAQVPQPNMRNLVGAAGLYRAALRLEPRSPAALSGLLEIYKDLGFVTELQSTASTLLEVDPANTTALKYLAGVAIARDEWKVAKERVDQLVRIEPTNVRWRELAIAVMAGAGMDGPSVLQRIDVWRAEGEPDGRYRYLSAMVYDANGQRLEALGAAEAAAAAGMPDTETLSRLIDVLDRLGAGFPGPDDASRAARERASKAADTAIQKSRAGGVDEIDVALMQVRRHWLAGRLDDAREVLAGCPTGEKGDERRFEPFRWAVILAVSSPDDQAGLADAIARLRSAAAGDAKAAPQIHWVDAIVAARGAADQAGSPAGSADSAIVLAMADEQNERDPILPLLAGDAALRRGEFDVAANRYSRSFELSGQRWVEAGVRSVNATLRGGKTEAGFRASRDLVRRFPTNVGVLLAFSEACTALAREGRSPSLVDPSLPRSVTGSSLLEAIFKESGERVEFLPAILSAKLAEGDRAGGMRVVERALSDQKVPPALLLLMAQECGSPEAGDAADKLLRAAADRQGSPAEIAAIAARIRLQRGDAAAARRIAEEALAGPANTEQAARLARIVAAAAGELGDADASQLLQRCLSMDGDPVESAEFVLSQTAAWNDETLIDAAIGKLARALTPQASQGDAASVEPSRVVLAKAARTLRFHPGTPQVAEAIKSVNAVLAASPESPPVLVTMGRLLAADQNPDYAQAAKYMEKALELQPSRRDLYPELIQTLQLAGDHSSAARYLQQYMSGESTADDRRLAAGLLLGQGRYAEAAQTLEQVARGGRETDLVALGDAQRRAGQLEKAEQSFAAAFALPGKTGLSTMAYAEFLARVGRLAEARQLIVTDAGAASPSLPAGQRAALQARLELDYGDPKDARPFVDEAVRLLPDMPAVALIHARYLRAIGDEQGALAAAKAGLTQAPKDQALLAFLSTALIADPARSKEAEEALAAIRGVSPEVAALLEVVRRAAGPNGEMKPTLALAGEAERLTESYPSFAPAWRVAIEFYVGAGSPQDAIRVARRGMSRVPTEPGPAEMATRLLLADRRFAEARDCAKAWRALTADSPLAADLVLAELALREGKAKDAVSILSPYLNQLAAANSRTVDGIALYAAATGTAGGGDEAFRRLAARLASDPAARGEWLRGLRTLPTAEAMQALARLESAAASDDERLALAAEYTALARRADGANAAARAQAIMGAMPPAVRAAPGARAIAADLQCAQGDVAGGVAAYQALWQDIPAGDRDMLLRWATLDAGARDRLRQTQFIAVYANNNMASALAAAGLDLDAALDAATRTTQLLPGQPDCLDTMAQVRLARKEFDAARQAADAAIAAAPDAAGLLLTRAEIDLAAGQVAEAQARLAKVEALLSGDTLAEPSLRERLAKLREKVAAAQQSST